MIRSVVSLSALAFIAGGVGLIGTNFLSPGSKSESPPEKVTLTSASADAFADPLETEAPVLLTSFTDLEPVRSTYERTEVLQPRETLTDLMDRVGVSRSEANSALYALYDEGYIDPRKVHPGLEMTAYVESAPSDDNPDGVRLIGLTMKHEREASLIVSRGVDGGYTAHELHTRLEPVMRRVTGTVQTSLYEAALQAGAHDAQVYDFAQIYAYDVDFQREMRAGDRFEIVFEELVDERGEYVRSGEILYASLDGHAVDRGFYQFTPSDDGITDYFDEDGQSARKFLMKTPINGARLSSNFGYRKHPISGYSKLHKGTDFAAPTGTPIYAAGNGVVERASWYGGYGNYVRLRHPNGYQTAYAHMSKYGPGVKSGVRVKQGDIIGYVGSTGASTGPHLHYEVIKDGNAMNAMSLKLPTGRVLEGDQLEEFRLVRSEIDQIRGVDETNTLFALSTQTEAMSETTTE
ncbi:MAG: peptidase M23 [Ponticaulis sp.]|nr:peptidase M23 [Ponticaulis sp.]